MADPRIEQLPPLIGLGYKAQAGKDTVGNILMDYGYKRFAFADPLKAILAELNPIIDPMGRRVSTILGAMKDWEEAKDSPEVRRLLQHLGSACRTNIHQGVWVGPTMAAVDRHVKGGGLAVITDMRYPNEVEAIRKRGGLVVNIERHGSGRGTHSSEIALDEYTDWDHVVFNDGTFADLAGAVEKILTTEPLPEEEADDETRA